MPLFECNFLKKGIPVQTVFDNGLSYVEDRKDSTARSEPAN
jgi:hypothetical protein